MSALTPEDDPPEVASAASDFFEMSLDHLCVTAFDGSFVRVNPSWTRTLGWTPEELMSRNSISFVHPDDRAATLAGRARLHQGRALGPLINRYLCKDGSHRWFEWRSIAQLDRRVVYAAARDVTEQKQLEESLRSSQEQEAQLERRLLLADRMASIGTLAAGAAHEINNPLAAIAANLTLILEELGVLRLTIPPEQLAELTQMATDSRTAAETIRNVIHGLKTFSRAADEQRSVIDVRSVLELSLSLTSHQISQRARLVTHYGATPPIHADAARLGQVFVNLLVNACQAIPEGDVPAHEIRISTSTDRSGLAVIEIRDTGRGIPAASLAQVFDPFFTTKKIGEGTGLGLSICHNLVSAIGGSITVTSEAARGTTFRVEIPAAVAAPVDAGAMTTGIRVPSAVRANVLVVDDDPVLGAAIRRVLRDHSVTVVTAAAAALSRLDAGEKYDVILSDMMMPEMSGMEFYGELVRRHPDDAARVVFISGGTFTAGATAFLAQVPNERLEKPFPLETLRALIRRFAK